MISIKEIAKKDFYTLSSSDSVESAVELIEKGGVDYLLVEEEGEIKGVVTSHELVGYPSSRLVLDCKIKPIATISEETWLDEALKVLEGEKEVNFLVVLNKEGSPIGVINKEIIISFLYQEVKKSNKAKEREVTERKRAEEQLRILSSVAEQSTNSIAILDKQGIIVEYVNPKLLELYEISPDEVVGKNWQSWLSMYSTLREKLPEMWNTVLERGTTWKGEVTDRSKRGEVVWRAATIFPIKDAKGEIAHIVYVSEDITERKQAGEALRESEERYRTLVEGLEEVIVSFSLDGTILYCSPNVKNFGGYDAEEEIGHHFIRYIADEEAKQKLQ